MISMRAMKWIDHWLGLPICTALAAVYSFRRKRPINNPRTIVIAKFFGMGSVLLASPMARAIRQRHPDAKIIFLTFLSNRWLAEMTVAADEIWTLRPGFYTFPLDTLRIVARLWRRRPDTFIDLEFYSKYSTILCALSGASARFGYYLASFWRNGIYTHPVFFNHRVHITRLYAEIARELGARFFDATPSKLAVCSGARTRLYAMYRQLGIDGPRVALNVNASDLAFCRRWPLENFKLLIERLVDERGVTVLLTGSGGEAAYTESCRRLVDTRYRERVFNLAGKLDIEMLLACYEDVPLLITNDSGPLHLAAAQGCPTLTIWGAGDPHMYGPNDEKHGFVYLDYPCSPCMYIYRTNAGHFCHGMAPCLTAITPEMAWREFLNMEERGLTVARDAFAS